jgi:hypothetical protein
MKFRDAGRFKAANPEVHKRGMAARGALRFGFEAETVERRYYHLPTNYIKVCPSFLTHEFTLLTVKCAVSVLLATGPLFI